MLVMEEAVEIRVLSRLSGDQDAKIYDFTFATGAPRKQTMELASLAFIEHGENLVFAKACRRM